MLSKVSLSNLPLETHWQKLQSIWLPFSHRQRRAPSFKLTTHHQLVGQSISLESSATWSSTSCSPFSSSPSSLSSAGSTAISAGHSKGAAGSCLEFLFTASSCKVSWLRTIHGISFGKKIDFLCLVKIGEMKVILNPRNDQSLHLGLGLFFLERNTSSFLSAKKID